MDTINATMDLMKLSINKRMEEFEAQLCTIASYRGTSSNIYTEFCALRDFVTKALKLLQQQVETLAWAVDNMETGKRRKILLFHGVEEKNDKNTAATVSNIIKKHFNVSIPVDKIKYSHRIGKTSTPEKPRPLLVKFQNIGDRDKLWFNKTKLKGSGITVTEFLTKTKHDLFMTAREKLGVSKCWTRGGHVYVLGADEVKHKVNSFEELNRVIEIFTTSVAVNK